jgi:branched-chain amino acid transport system ATP-binding protein
MSMEHAKQARAATVLSADSQAPAVPLLLVEGLTAGYGETLVLRDVSLSVGPGSVVAVLGPNGAGKTTLLKAVSGLLRPQAGTIMLRGEAIEGKSADFIARRGICHIPEGRGIFPSLTVAENIVLQARKGEERRARDRVAEVLPTLSSRMDQVAGSLSGGEQQVLALARAYLADPALVVVDEASLGLAPVIVDRVFEALAQIAAQGTALLLVEQYVTRALTLADHVYLLDRGRVAWSGPACDVDGAEIASRYLGVDSR